ncbi:MAG: response regulator transcription factor [Chitinophagales bacterium]|nr:response regulator transcription factor [Chitinophagales bacterium]MDW8419054.1 response regulator transcription factor [Chitinophagales bacterium]
MSVATQAAKRVLLAEDEENLRHVIRMNLEMEGYEVDEAENGIKTLKLAKNGRYNLIILDVMMPEMDGFTVCQNIRLEDTHTPILFLTAKDTSQDIVEGLKNGADDYITKPFNLEEFLLRVKVLVKHSVRGNLAEERAMGIYRFGECEIDFNNLKATGVGGKKIDLTKREVELLKLLVEKRGLAVSRKQILEVVWGYDVFPTTRTIDNFINSFRKYFEKDPSNPRHFHSVRGIGYKFTEQEE